MSLQTVPLSAMINVIATTVHAAKIERTLEAADAVHKCWLFADDLKANVDVVNPAHTRDIRIIDDRDGFYTWTDFPPNILLSPNAKYLEFVLLHEIGHYLDHWHLDIDRQFATRASGRLPDIQNWYNAVQQTPLVRRLQAYDLSQASQEQRGEIEYLKHPTELWACSYAQYIAQTSGYGELRRQAGRYCVDDIFACRQWPEVDFKPVYKAVEQILDGRGWL